MPKKVSIIIPVFNEEGNLHLLIERITNTLESNSIIYEIIFIDDHSSDHSKLMISLLILKHPIRYFEKKGKKGKAQSLLEGFQYAAYDLICMIDADLQYPPESIPEMIAKIDNGADVVVTNRKENHVSFIRKTIGNIFVLFFAKILHGFPYDVQSGLKLFKKEIIERISLHPSVWAFDLEFLIKARDAGYTIASHDIVFSKRHSGNSKIGLLRASFEIGFAALKLKLLRPEAIPFHPNTVEEKGQGFHYKGKEFIHHSNLHISKNALHRLSGKQVALLWSGLILLLISFTVNWHTTIIILVALLTVLYFADLLFNLFLIFRSFSNKSEILISDEEIAQVPNTDWPKYTVFCPLYKEWKVLPQFVTAMSKLDYPKEKLQVMLLLEEDDLETIEHARNYNLPEFFSIVIVPHSQPKTKPKASNYGLKHATGEFAVIYDAEDIPDTKQLKKALLAFKKAGKRTICIQAKLNFYNPHQNILTRVFTAEYSLWFDLVLTGLQSIHAPIPLGGTSNHFKTADLHKLKGWDSFNVTEDCDLGMRLVKQGYQTALVQSITLEEANSDMRNWFWQRTRWIKGYMQTYLLHMRDPLEFVKTWKEPHFATFQLIVGGKVLSMFINPLMWVITISYFVFRSHVGLFIESFFPAPVLYMGIVSLLLGNFLYTYYYMVGCVKHGHDELVKYIFLVPFYWLAMSVAAWVAFYKLLTAPHYWSKTKHGLHLDNTQSATYVGKKIGRELIDTDITIGEPMRTPFPDNQIFVREFYV